MTEWCANLKGDEADLYELLALFRLPDLNIVQDERAYWLRSSTFAALTEAEDVLKQAREVIQYVNGAAKVYLPSYQPVEIGGIMRIDDQGRKHQYIFANSIVLRTVFGHPTLSIDGVPVPPPSLSKLELASSSAQKDESIAKALRIFSREHTWDNLYRVFEVVQSDVGNMMFDLSWVSKREVACFKRTANSAAALGDEARHGVEHTQPPTSPMSRSEAIEFVRKLLVAWLDQSSGFRGR